MQVESQCSGGLVDRFTQKGGYKPMLRCRNRQCSAKKGIHYNEAELLGQLQGFRWNQFFRDDRKGELLSQINQQMLAEQDELNKEKRSSSTFRLRRLRLL